MPCPAGPALASILRSSDEGVQAQASRELVAAENRLDELAADYASGTVSRRVLDHRPVVLRDLPADDAELRHQWDAGTVA